MGKGFERLTAQDSSFVIFEGAGCHIHVTATAIFELGPLLASRGGLDMVRMRAHIESRLPQLTHYRQKLSYTPLQRHPIWVDDPRFDLSYHVRHAALPLPGSDEELKTFTANIASQPLERDKPLWEIWLSIFLLIATTAFAIWIAAKIFRFSLLMTGKRPSLRTILRLMRAA